MHTLRWMLLLSQLRTNSPTKSLISKSKLHFTWLPRLNSSVKVRPIKKPISAKRLLKRTWTFTTVPYRPMLVCPRLSAPHTLRQNLHYISFLKSLELTNPHPQLRIPGYLYTPALTPYRTAMPWIFLKQTIFIANRNVSATKNLCALLRMTNQTNFKKLA